MTTAHETSTSFSDEVMKEHNVFELSKKQEMKDLLQTYADGQVEMLQRVSLFLYPLYKLKLSGDGRLGSDHPASSANTS